MMELIVNVTENWGIGMGDRLLVTIHADLKRFRALTMGKAVILGRKTLQTFPAGRPLKGRRNLILSTQSGYHVEGAEVAHHLDELFSMLGREESACVIGGESIYRLLLPYCTHAYVTKTHVNLPADRFFPNLDALAHWHLESISALQEEDGVLFQYCDYINTAPMDIRHP